MPLEQSFLEYLEEREKKNTGFTPLYDAPSLDAPKPAIPQETKNFLYDMVGSGLWAFGDEFLFGVEKPEKSITFASMLEFYFI